MGNLEETAFTNIKGVRGFLKPHKCLDFYRSCIACLTMLTTEGTTESNRLPLPFKGIQISAL